MKKKGFTLIEVLISASIFSVIFLIGTQSYISAVKQSFFSTSNQVFDNQIQIFINRLDQLIENNKINLNEYFVQCHKAGKCPFYGESIEPVNLVNFGQNEGLYYHQFFDLGLKQDGSNDGYSYECTNNDCSLGIIESTQDIFTGYFGVNEKTNAICNFEGPGFTLLDKSFNNYETFISKANCNQKELEFSTLFLKSQNDSSLLFIGNSNGDLVYQELKNKENIFLENGLPTYFASYEDGVNYQTLMNSNQIINFKNLKIENFKVKVYPLENIDFARAENFNKQNLAPRVEISFEISQKDSSSLFKLFDKKVNIHKIYNL